MQLIFMYFCSIQGLFHHWDDVLLVCPGGQFGDHPAKGPVHVLVRNEVGKDLTVPQNRSGSIITGGFDAKDVNAHKFLSYGQNY
jgi:hypothetical protein